jgi:energy-coupling factor transport system ATP-binding protein
MEGLTVTYGAGETAVCDVNLRVQAGEFVLVTGVSGCGKTTLARCLNGLIPHLIPCRVQGTIQVAGLNPLREGVHRMASQVGMVFQVPETQLFNLSVEEEVAFGCHNLGLSADETAGCVEFALGSVGMESYRGRALHKLSGGEKQLVSIASVLAMQPKIMVLDEPLSHVDATGVRRVMDVLTHLNQTMGMTVILIEHRTHQVADSASRIIVMDKGRIVMDGGPDLLCRERERLVALGVRVPFLPEEADSVACPVPVRSSVDSIVSVRNVHFGYKGRKVLDNVSLELQRGEFLALVGDSGAGKTTLAHLIAGVLKPASGTIKINENGHGAQKVGLLLQNPSDQLFCDTVEEEVRFGPENFGIPADGVVEEVLQCTNLNAFRTREMQHLSRGQQQRLSLASVLALKPEILILDEPTLGQDWGHLIRFLDFVKDLQCQGATVMLITHDYEAAAKYADRVVRLRDGKIAA